MTVNQFISELQSLKEELKDKEIIIIAPNGIEMEPKIRRIPIIPYDIFGEVKNIVITYE